ncbi:MAG: VWA domain-containing protein [Burkholderiaceae bacterium]
MPIEPVRKRRRLEQPRLFILVDVSRSMETHAQLFLRISRAFVGVADARVFVFYTRRSDWTTN